MIGGIKKGMKMRARKARDIVKVAMFYIVLGIGGLTMLAPFFWMLSTSLKPDNEIFIYPPRWLPMQVTFENFRKVWKAVPFGRYLFNSAFVAFATTFSQVFLCSLAAYGFARKRFPGKDAIFMAVLGTMMVPMQVTMIPLFILMREMPFGGETGWIDTYWGLIVPGMVSAFSIFLLRQFFQTIPRDLEDAARIDGCGSLRIYFSIILPLAKPALSSVAIFNFIGSWNSFIWPLIIASKEKMRTLPVGLSYFQSQYTISWGLLMAASVLATLPIVIIFLFMQREFVEGIVMSGLKE